MYVIELKNQDDKRATLFFKDTSFEECVELLHKFVKSDETIDADLSYREGKTVHYLIGYYAKYKTWKCWEAAKQFLN